MIFRDWNDHQLAQNLKRYETEASNPKLATIDVGIAKDWVASIRAEIEFRKDLTVQTMYITTKTLITGKIAEVEWRPRHKCQRYVSGHDLVTKEWIVGTLGVSAFHSRADAVGHLLKKALPRKIKSLEPKLAKLREVERDLRDQAAYMGIAGNRQ